MWRGVYTRFYCACISLYLLARAQITYRILIDSGSTGSRVYIYSYESSTPLSTLQEVAHMRVRPALATYYHKFAELNDQMQQFITFAMEHIPSDRRAESHIALKATAGLRVIEEEQQEWLMEGVRRILSSSSFYFDPSETGVLSGEEEALFGLLATNLAYGNFSDAQGGFTLAAADLGGSSKQIAFMLPSPRPYTLTVFGREVEIPLLSNLNLWSQANPQHYPEECRPDYRLLLPGSYHPIEIFARSIAGLGLVESMHEAFTVLSQRNSGVDVSSEHNQTDSDNDQARIDPILLYEESRYSCNVAVGKGWEEDDDNISEELDVIEVEETLAGSLAVCDASSSLLDRGSSQSLRTLLHVNFSSTESSPDASDVIFNPCAPPGENLFYPENLAHLSWIGSGKFDECAGVVKEMVVAKAGRESACMRQVKFPTIIAMDNFPKVLEILRLSIDQPVTPHAIKEAGQAVCQRPWQDIMIEFHHRIPEYRAQQACFGAAFIYTVATELYGLNEHDSTSFLPTDSHHSYTIGWPLGATIFAATDITTALVPNSST